MDETTATGLLQTIEIELSSIGEHDYQIPPFEPESDDKVLGDANERAKKLWTLAVRYSYEHQRMHLDAGIERYPEMKKILLSDSHRCRSKYRIVSELFWYEIKEQFPELWLLQEVAGIRNNWKVVMGSPPPDFRRIFGLE